MRVSDFDYNLPTRLIADQPPSQRGASRLLVLDRANGGIMDSVYADLADYLQAGDVLVLNDTRVIKARLKAAKPNGAERELVVLESHSAVEDWHRHRVIYRGRLAVGDELRVGDQVVVVNKIEGGGIAEVYSKVDLLKLTSKYGQVPLPPYVKRKATTADAKRYQTVFARQAGSAAAPTASLNMTKKLLNRLGEQGVTIKYLTLHVGLGTFLPIREDEVERHQIHSEYFEIPADTINEIKAAKDSGRRVIAVGTTVARTLEYAATAIKHGRQPSSNEADIFIYPGYEFQIVDALLTNFHAPRSTVLLLAAAFAGLDNLRLAYDHAKESDYKFLSYGDSMLIL